MRPMHKVVATLAMSLALFGCGGGGDDSPVPVEQVLIDADYNTMSDDGQLGTMAMQLHAAGKLKVLGITVVPGNDWLQQQVADALKSVERMGLESTIKVYAGDDTSAAHCAFLEQTVAAGGGSLSGGSGVVGTPYKGACSTSAPRPLVAPPDGFATRAQLQPQHAVDFIIDTIRANPGKVTILAVGPVTNIARAVEKAPDIGPKIKQIIFQAGNFEPPGPINTFNSWFDYQAANVVAKLPVPMILIPRDVTNVTPLTKPVYDRIANAVTPTPITEIFKNQYINFANNPNATTFVWDVLALAYLMDPSFATVTVDQYVEFVGGAPSAKSGFSQAYDSAPGNGIQKMTWVKRFDNARFFDWYVELLTRPIPAAAR